MSDAPKLVCADCTTPKPPGNFSPGQQARNKPRCQVCVSARNRKYRMNNASAIKAKKASTVIALRGTDVREAA